MKFLIKRHQRKREKGRGKKEEGPREQRAWAPGYWKWWADPGPRASQLVLPAWWSHEGSSPWQQSPPGLQATIKQQLLFPQEEKASVCGTSTLPHAPFGRESKAEGKKKARVIDFSLPSSKANTSPSLNKPRKITCLKWSISLFKKKNLIVWPANLSQ